jgi:hypothetical protein
VYTDHYRGDPLDTPIEYHPMSATLIKGRYFFVVTLADAAGNEATAEQNALFYVR